MLARFKAFFDKASWRLCARLRANQTWKEASRASQAVMADTTAFQEAMARMSPWSGTDSASDSNLVSQVGEAGGPSQRPSAQGRITAQATSSPMASALQLTILVTRTWANSSQLD